MERKPLAQDVDTEQTLRVDATVQDILTGLAAEFAGASVAEVAQALRERLAAAGLPEQPAPWVDASAREISAGRVVVADTRAEIDPDEPGED